MSVGMFPLSNQMIPLPINYDTDVSSGNGVPVSDSEVLAVLGVYNVDRKERVVWLQIRRKKRHKPPFLVPKNQGKANRRIFNFHLFYIQSESSNTMINDTFQLIGNTSVAAEIW